MFWVVHIEILGNFDSLLLFVFFFLLRLHWVALFDMRARHGRGERVSPGMGSMDGWSDGSLTGSAG